MTDMFKREISLFKLELCGQNPRTDKISERQHEQVLRMIHEATNVNSKIANIQ